MAEEEQQRGAHITTPLGSIKFFGANLAEFILVIILCIVSVGAYLAFDLREDIRYQNRVNYRMLQSIRLQNCLATLEISRRNEWLEWCRREVSESGTY
jgi:hypothetical protein